MDTVVKTVSTVVDAVDKYLPVVKSILKWFK